MLQTLEFRLRDVHVCDPVCVCMCMSIHIILHVIRMRIGKVRQVPVATGRR